MLALFNTHCAGLMDDSGDGLLEVPWHFNGFPTNILYKGMTNDDNEMCMMKVYINMDDLKDYS